MLRYPDIDPVALSVPAFDVFGLTLGPLNVHWYGLMYLFGFVAALLLGLHRAKRSYSPLQPKQIEDLIFYGAVGLVVGGRIGYVFFYNFGQFLDDPLWLFRVWEGGMSFHGGALGVMAAMGFYAKKIQQNFVDVMDFLVPLAPIGLGLGRIGNFIGQELWGRATTVPWGMIFPKDPETIRHPSQLYQASLEGFTLFVIVFWFSRKPRPRAAVSGLFLIFYGIFRFSMEFVRQPDSHIGFDFFGWLTRGQILTLPMILAGVLLMVWAYKFNAKALEEALSSGQKQKKPNKKASKR